MGGVPGGDGGFDYGSLGKTTVTSSANDEARYTMREYGVSLAQSRLDVTTLGRGRSSPASISLKFSFRMASFTNATVTEGTNEYGGTYGKNLFQSVRCEASIEFDGTTGTPLAVTLQELEGRNLAAQFGTMFNTTTSVLMNGSLMTYEGKSYGKWVAAELRWPVWEISGANFRFFGQNWIRLIKVSGP